MKKPKILFAASEMTPIAKVGGLADVVSALPKALRAKNIDCRVILPRYEQIKTDGLETMKKDVAVEFGNIKEKVNIYSGEIDGVQVYFIENEKYLSRGLIYLDKSAFVSGFDEIKRFLFFSQAVIQVLSDIKFNPDIVHCHDWHTALIPGLLSLSLQKKSPKTILTIHNIANQGIWNAEEILSFLGLSGIEWSALTHHTPDGSLNLFEQGVSMADRLTTVSPTYARELLTPEYGFGLEPIIEERKNDLIGILNGIDIDRYNPETDPLIPFKFSLENLSEREKNREALLQKTDLELAPHAPIFGFIGRLAVPDQKGVELMASIADEFAKRGAGVIFLGSGDDMHQKLLLGVDKMFPKNFFPFIGFDAAFAQLMYAGCDFMLVPSKFEPCGLVQMMAMRYGSIPVVRQTGGLADSVKNLKCTPKDCTGTGIVFQDFNRHDLREAIDRACKLFQQKHLYKSVQQNAISADFSWNASARKYIKLYQSLLL